MKSAKNAFIATQGPLKNTVFDFWKMVHQHNTRCIIMVTKLYDDNDHEKCYPYYPENQGESISDEDFKIENIESNTMGQSFYVNKFKLTHLASKEERVVT